MRGASLDPAVAQQGQRRDQPLAPARRAQRSNAPTSASASTGRPVTSRTVEEELAVA